MLHQKTAVGLLNGLCDQVALDVPPIDKVVLKIAIAPADGRFSDKAGDLKIFALIPYFKQLCRNVSAVYMIDQILSVSVAGGMQLGLVIVYVFKRNVRMRKSKLFQHITDVGSFCLGRL